MPDMKVINISSGAIEMPSLNDSVSGAEALAQTAALMLLDPTCGNLEFLLKKRIDSNEIGEIILRAVDNVERVMLDEQVGLVLPDSEILSSLDIISAEITNDNVAISIRVLNQIDDESIVTI